MSIIYELQVVVGITYEHELMNITYKHELVGITYQSKFEILPIHL